MRECTELRLGDLAAMIGQEVARSQWHEITQQQIDRFAEATEDFQWIHVDPARAAESVYGNTIAHGYLTLSLLSKFRTEAVQVVDAERSVNYGLNKVRFITPVVCGDRVRACFGIRQARLIRPSEWEFIWDCVIDIEGKAKPACVAEAISRYYGITKELSDA